MSKLSICLIEDEKKICHFIKTTLEHHDYKVTPANTAKEGLELITSLCPDLILLDLGLPDMDGVRLIRELRGWSSIPIIVISARTQEADKVAALDSGADDYITKPFGTEELMARIRTALRHGKPTAADEAGNLAQAPYLCGGLCIDFSKRAVTVDGQEVHLTQIEYKLVTLLATHAGRVLTYDFIIIHIWGPYADRNNQILRVNMAHIRRKIEKNPAQPQYIYTEVGVGYRMKDCD